MAESYIHRLCNPFFFNQQSAIDNQKFSFFHSSPALKGFSISQNDPIPRRVLHQIAPLLLHRRQSG